jgi:hypothetical protein
MAENSNSPLKFVPIVGAAVSAGLSIFGAVKANQAKKQAQREAKKKEAEMKRLKDIYANLDTSNPYLNMENTMEDLTINQQQAQFQSQQFAQSQANIMGELRGAAGGSGIAALAQSLAQQGQIASQQSSASIGQQEAANQRAAAAEAGRIQGMERQGEVYSRNLEREKQSTLLGMSQQELAGAQQRIASAEQAKMSAISGGIQGAASMVAGFGDQTDYKSLYEDLKGES